MKDMFKIKSYVFLASALLITVTVQVIAFEEKGVEKTETSPSNLDIMRHLMNSWSIRTKEKRSEPLTFGQDPVLRYTDPKYKMTDCAIWRLGKKGRPRAYVTVEMGNPRGNTGLATFEFLAVSEGPFRINGRGVSWQPWELGVDFKPLPGAPQPAATAPERLEQMKQLAIRFSAEEMLGREKIYLNLHPEPFDRYQPTDAKNSDAAVFLFERNSNPEVILFFETDGKKWSYGCGKLSATAVLVKLDKKEVWSNPKTSSRPKPDQVGYHWTNGYTAGRVVFQVPHKLRTTPVKAIPVQPIPARANLLKLKTKQLPVIQPKKVQPKAVQPKVKPQPPQPVSKPASNSSSHCC